MSALHRTTNIKSAKAITPVEYKAFQQAYDFFNAELFAGSLPNVLVTLQRHAKMRGYFHAKRFNGRVEETDAHELALNPDGFTGRTDEDILGTLSHEMVHVWQHTHGTPSGGGYHNREWAERMKKIGLHPSRSGEHGDRETGQTCSHYIVSGGPYALAYKKLQSKGFQLHWQSAPATEQSRKKLKVKYTCPTCGLNAWAKPDVVLMCGACFAAVASTRKLGAIDGKVLAGTIMRSSSSRTT